MKSQSEMQVKSGNSDIGIKLRYLESAQNSTDSTGASDSNSNTPSGIVSIPESSKKWTSNLTTDERQQYESMLDMKNSFKISLTFLPKSFRPDDLQYKINIQKVIGIFLGFAIVTILLIFIFMILRFCFKKCVGPVKSSQVTIAYRNITWLIMSKDYLINF